MTTRVNSRSVTITLTAEQLEHLDTVAKAQRRTRSNAVGIAVAAYLVQFDAAGERKQTSRTDRNHTVSALLTQ